MDTFRTRDGVKLRVRPISPADKDALATAFERLSPESRYRRFMAPIKHLRTKDLRYLTEIDHHDHEALLAIGPDDAIVGVARCIRLPSRPTSAEAAVTVADAWQGRGVGTELLRRLARRAREEGVGSFTGTCFAENHDVQLLFEELGPHMKSRSDGPGVVEFEVDLPTSRDHPGLWVALRAAAAGNLRPHASRSARSVAHA